MKQEIKATNISQAILWFGASVSIAEILTGALIAPIGLGKGLSAIFLGHLIGCSILYFTGFIGAKTKLSAIESTKISFGSHGAYVFSILNIIQLVGWTGVMIINGANAFDEVTKGNFGFSNVTLWCIGIAIFICIWILVGFKNLNKINIVAVGMLLIFSCILGYVVFSSKGAGSAGALVQSLSFGAAVELSVIMPLSWLPLISDYTRHVKHEKMGTLFSTGGYFFGSCLMYSIGLGAALFAGTSNITVVLMSVGLPVVALMIVLFSTVTTAFLDVYSAAISFLNLNNRCSEKVVSAIVCGLGLVIALLFLLVNTSHFFT